MGLRRFIVTLTWTMVAAFLFFGFGLLFAGGVARTLVALGALDEGSLQRAAEIALVAFGPVVLLVSLIYRRVDGGENAGSLAAWLAGWALVLFGTARLLDSVSETLAVGFLVAVLLTWAAAAALRRLTRPRQDP